MTPKTKKLFISYRSSDHREVDAIAEQLRSLTYDDGEPKFITWQDKHDLKGGKSWWDGIIDAIIDCHMFVFHLSPEYLASKVCMAELDYAIERGRPIIPIVLDTAYYINPRTKKADINFWDAVPEWLGTYQFIFYDDDDFLKRFEDAVAECELAWPDDIPARRPLNPDADSLHGTNYEVYATAVDYVQRVAFEDAKPLFRELVRRNDEDFAEICRQWLIIMNQYQELLDARQHRAPWSVFRRKWEAYVSLFPLDFVDDLYPDIDDEMIVFDPNHLGKQNRKPKKKAPSQAQPSVEIAPSASPESVAVASPAISTKPSSLSLMPKPFEWIEIPAGQVTLGRGWSGKAYGVRQRFQIDSFEMAKYPVTNAQFHKFIEADGYNAERWWTKDGWTQRQAKEWIQPLYFTSSQLNLDKQPVVGVSWYEAVAFCLWLSDVTGEKIMLPTEQQWQFAAQGSDGRTYPWGNDWNRDLCNSDVDHKGIGKTTTVKQYEGKGDSPFGIVDMIGNVSEWCLTQYYTGSNDLEGTESRAHRSGSWMNDNPVYFGIDLRFSIHAYSRTKYRGFRVSRS